MKVCDICGKPLTDSICPIIDYKRGQVFHRECDPDL